MVATAIYSVTMVLWKETAFPLCRAIIIIIIIIIIVVDRRDRQADGWTPERYIDPALQCQ